MEEEGPCLKGGPAAGAAWAEDTSSVIILLRNEAEGCVDTQEKQETLQQSTGRRCHQGTRMEGEPGAGGLRL
jgi:hypothetical protein